MIQDNLTTFMMHIQFLRIDINQFYLYLLIMFLLDVISETNVTDMFKKYLGKFSSWGNAKKEARVFNGGIVLKNEVIQNS